jgi:glyoxylate/hydroxypyruvate reductase A
MTRVALLSRTVDMAPLARLMLKHDASLDLHAWPDEQFLQAEVAVCWEPPQGIFTRMPRLQLVHGIAAGIDNVIEGQALGDLPVCRVTDPGQAEGMLQYVLWGVLHFHRSFDEAQRNQTSERWQRPRLRPAADCRVGILGLGEVGAPVARGLARMGYSVSGWSRSAKTLDGVRCLHGDAGLQTLLQSVEILVCLLPLTEQTRGMLNAQLFAQLPPGAALVHCGRGAHLVPDDLLAVLRDGRLRGALVDVFPQEPLPPGHPLWAAPNLVVTPHMATMAPFDVVARQIVENIHRLRDGRELQGQVDLLRGY